MRIVLRPVFTAAAFISFATAAGAQRVPTIIGDYSMAGTAGGAKYGGTASLTLIGGDMYRATYVTSSRNWPGTCFRDGATLSCASCVQPGIPTVTAYMASAKGMDGVFFFGVNTQVGREVLTPKGYRVGTKEVRANAGQMNPTTFVGEFDAKGTDAVGSAYTGTASVKQLIAVSPNAYLFDLVIGANHMHNVGVRDATRPVFAVGNCKGGSGGMLAIIYSIDEKGRTLTGSWTQEFNGVVTVGTEILSRAR